VTGPRRSGDVPVVDNPPSGSSRFVMTRVLQRLEALELAEDRPFWRTIAMAGLEASADRFASLLLLLHCNRLR